MKAVLTIILFFIFLLIRSGNSHEVINHSNRPAISFMEQPISAKQISKVAKQQSQIIKTTSSSSTTSDSNQVVIDHDEDDFQLWKDYHLQMALFSSIICFTFLWLIRDRQNKRLMPLYVINHSQDILITQRSLRI